MHFFRQGNKHMLLIAITPVLVVVAIISLTTLIKDIFNLDPGSLISTVISVLEAIGLIISLIIAIKQLSDSKEITRATFLIELNKSFVENQDYLDLYNMLQNCLDNCCKCGNKCNNSKDLNEPCNLNILKGQISNYLTFFETVYILQKNGVISFSVIDDLFAYRFFLVVHSKIIQQMKIKAQPQNFRNIFCLENEWMEWRKKHGKDLDDSVDTVYNRLKLENLVTPELYQELIKARER